MIINQPVKMVAFRMLKSVCVKWFFFILIKTNKRPMIENNAFPHVKCRQMLENDQKTPHCINIHSFQIRFFFTHKVLVLFWLRLVSSWLEHWCNHSHYVDRAHRQTTSAASLSTSGGLASQSRNIKGVKIHFSFLFSSICTGRPRSDVVSFDVPLSSYQRSTFRPDTCPPPPNIRSSLL